MGNLRNCVFFVLVVGLLDEYATIPDYAKMNAIAEATRRQRTPLRRARAEPAPIAPSLDRLFSWVHRRYASKDFFVKSDNNER